ncbi:MAG TPA: hypothetical protein ENK91_12270 [Bacteroidetes bacterium]|nr:hypothetical protein [Bacteroidota bacterium]
MSFIRIDKKKAFFLWICSFFLSFSLFGQGVVVHCILEDDRPVSQVAVELYQIKTKKVVAFGLTGAHGYIHLRAAADVYLLEAKHLSFGQVTMEISIDSSLDTIVCRMFPKKIEIGEIVVKEKMNMGSLKGDDTLSYNLNAFVNGKEEKLKDVINKLPGMEVTETGKIKVNGKIVDNLLIDGKEFFGDNQKAATDNIDAEMLDGIDLLKDFESFNPVKEIDRSQKTAVNVRLKEKYKGKLVGDVESLGAYRNSYQLHSNLFDFGRKFNFSGIFDVNNINAQTIGLQDYLSMSSGVQRDIRAEDRSPSQIEQLADLPKSLLSDNHLEKRDVKFGAINYAIYPNKKMKINGFSTINQIYSKEKKVSNRYFYSSGTNLEFIDSIRSRGGFLFNQSKLNLEYLPNKNTLLNYSIRFNPDNNNQDRLLNMTNSLNTVNQNIQEKQKKAKKTAGQQLSYISRISRFSLLSVSAYFEREHTKNQYFVTASDTLFGDVFGPIYQNGELRADEFGGIVKYSRKSRKNLWKIAVGYDVQNKGFLLNTNFSFDTISSVKFRQNNAYSFVSAERQKGLFQYALKIKIASLGVSHSIETNRNIYLAPMAKIKFAFKPTHELSFFYNRRLQSPSVEKMLSQKYVLDYRDYVIGNEWLYKNVIIENAVSLNYLLIDLFNGFLLYANSSVSKFKNPIGVNFFGESSFNKKEYSVVPSLIRWNSMVSTELRMSKLSTKIKMQFAYLYMKQLGGVNGHSNILRSHFFTHKLALSSLGKGRRFNYDLGVEYRLQLVNNLLIKGGQRSQTWLPFLNVSGDLIKNLSFNIDNKLFYFLAEKQKKKILEISPKIVYHKKNSRFRIWGVAHDILNMGKTSFLERHVEPNQVFLDSYSRLPGYIGLGISFSW